MSNGLLNYVPILISGSFAAVIKSWDIIPDLSGSDKITIVLIGRKREASAHRESNVTTGTQEVGVMCFEDGERSQKLRNAVATRNPEGKKMDFLLRALKGTSSAHDTVTLGQ